MTFVYFLGGNIPYFAIIHGYLSSVGSTFQLSTWTLSGLKSNKVSGKGLWVWTVGIPGCIYIMTICCFSRFYIHTFVTQTVSKELLNTLDPLGLSSIYWSFLTHPLLFVWLKVAIFFTGSPAIGPGEVLFTAVFVRSFFPRWPRWPTSMRATHVA